MTDESDTTTGNATTTRRAGTRGAESTVELPISPWQLVGVAVAVGLVLALVLMTGGTPAAAAAAGVVLVALPMLVARLVGDGLGGEDGGGGLGGGEVPGYVTLAALLLGVSVLGLLFGALDFTSTIALLLLAATGAGAVRLIGQRPAEGEVERPEAVAEARQTSDALRQQLRQSRDRADAAERAAQEARAEAQQHAEKARKLDQRLAAAALRLRDLAENPPAAQTTQEPTTEAATDAPPPAAKVGGDMQALHQQLQQAKETAAERDALAQELEAVKAEADRLKTVTPAETAGVTDEELQAERDRAAELERELENARQQVADLTDARLDDEDEGLPSIVVNDEDDGDDGDEEDEGTPDEGEGDEPEAELDRPAQQAEAIGAEGSPVARATDEAGVVAAARGMLAGDGVTAVLSLSRRRAEPTFDGDEADRALALRAAERVAETGRAETFTALAPLQDADLDGVTQEPAVRSAAAVPTRDGAVAAVGPAKAVDPQTARPLRAVATRLDAVAGG